MKPKDLYDMGKGIVLEDDETYIQCMPLNIVPIDDLNISTN